MWFVISNLISFNFLLSTIACSTETSDCNHCLDQQPLTNLSKHQQELCPPWLHFNSSTQTCHCFPYYGARCFDNRAYLMAGFCATYDEDTRIVSLTPCPYFQTNDFILSKRDIAWYIQLPENVSTLNDYMCGPLNRKGRVCSECMDGFGLALTSVGFRIQCCSNCTDSTWYGVPLYPVPGVFTSHHLLSHHPRIPN